MTPSTDRSKETKNIGARLPPRGETAGKILDDNLRPWSPPEVRVLPLDVTGNGNIFGSNREHTPHSWMSPVYGQS